MTRKFVAMLLVLVIGLLPVASAFATCAGSEHKEMNGVMMPYSSAIETHAEDATSHEYNTDSQDFPLAEMDCHTDGHCVFHLCGGFGLAASNQFIFLFYAHSQVILPGSFIKDRVLPPELRPPIITFLQRV